MHPCTSALGGERPAVDGLRREPDALRVVKNILWVDRLLDLFQAREVRTPVLSLRIG